MHELSKNLNIAWALASKEAKIRYSGSLGDIGWIVIGPSIYAVIFLVLRQQLSSMGVDLGTGGVNPVVYAFTGVLLWQVWYEALLKQIHFFKSGKSFLKSRPIPPEIFFYSQMIVSVSDLGIRLILIAIACLFFGQSPGNLFYLAPLAGLVLILTANALGLVLAVPGSFFPDISKTIQSISLGLFLVSPVFYSVPSDKESTLYILNQFNPFGVVLTAFHSIAYGTDPLMLIPWLIWVICLALLVPLLILYFRAVGPLIIERL